MADVQDGNGAGLVAFLDRISNHGEINPATARAFRAAVNGVLAVEAEPDKVDVRTVDVDALLERFENLNRARFKDDSLATYRFRFRRAVAMYRSWLDKDPEWKHAGTKRLRKATSSGSRPARVTRPRSSTVTPQDTVDSPTNAPERAPAPPLVVYDLPIRRDLIVRITLPVDLTTTDAERVCAFVRSLAFDVIIDMSPDAVADPTEDKD